MEVVRSMSQAKVARTSAPAMNGSVDLLSMLPEEVKLKILEHLPLQDAIRTGILSTHWRYKWAKLSKIIFDYQFFSTVVERRVRTSNILATYSKIINNVLLCHIGPLHSFDFYIPLCFASSTNIHEWLRSVSLKGISELTLTDDRDYMVTLPSTVFSYEGLTCLTLFGCTILALPPSFTGFPCLVNLELVRCVLRSSKVVESIISSCPQLRLLRLDNTEDFDLAIHAPKLEHLFLGGLFCKLYLGKDTTNMKTLHMEFLSDAFSSLQFSSLPVIQSLRLGHMCVWRFCNLGWIADLLRLKSQSLELVGIPINNAFITSFALTLLCCSRPLQRLYCQFSEYDFYEKEWRTLDQSSFKHPTFEIGSFPNLKYVVLDDVLGTNTELEFIKIILECAPLLKVITIILSFNLKKAEEKWQIALKLLQFSRASKNAKIMFKNETIG